jgi:hypothetical protein
VPISSIQQGLEAAMRRLSTMLFVALVSVGIIVMVIFARDVLAWESCGQDTGTAVADVEMYGAPSPAQCSTAKTEPTGSQTGYVIITQAAAINSNMS